MHQVTPDEFRVFQGDSPTRIAGPFSSGRKSGFLFIHIQDTAV